MKKQFFRTTSLSLRSIIFVGFFLTAKHAWCQSGDSRGFNAYASSAASVTGYSHHEITGFLTVAKFRPEILEAIARPAESMPWYIYVDRVITAKKVADGVRFMGDYRAELVAAENRYGVPKVVIASIIGIESNYGVNKGKIPVIDSLVTLAFNFPRREKFFQSELTEFLRQSRLNGQDPGSVLGSYAGAMGWPQFMPSSARRLAIDFDENGVTDLIGSPADSIGSVANYLSKSGWQEGGNAFTIVESYRKSSIELIMDGSGKKLVFLPGKNFQAILKYNRSKHYAMAVLTLANELAGSSGN